MIVNLTKTNDEAEMKKNALHDISVTLCTIFNVNILLQKVAVQLLFNLTKNPTKSNSYYHSNVI